MPQVTLSTKELQGIRKVRAAVLQMKRKQGVYYESWKAGMENAKRAGKMPHLKK